MVSISRARMRSSSLKRSTNASMSLLIGGISGAPEAPSAAGAASASAALPEAVPPPVVPPVLLPAPPAGAPLLLPSLPPLRPRGIVLGLSMPLLTGPLREIPRPPRNVPSFISRSFTDSRPGGCRAVSRMLVSSWRSSSKVLILFAISSARATRSLPSRLKRVANWWIAASFSAPRDGPLGPPSGAAAMGGGGPHMGGIMTGMPGIPGGAIPGGAIIGGIIAGIQPACICVPGSIGVMPGMAACICEACMAKDAWAMRSIANWAIGSMATCGAVPVEFAGWVAAAGADCAAAAGGAMRAAMPLFDTAALCTALASKSAGATSEGGGPPGFATVAKALAPSVSPPSGRGSPAAAGASAAMPLSCSAAASPAGDTSMSSACSGCSTASASLGVPAAALAPGGRADFGLATTGMPGLGFAAVMAAGGLFKTPMALSSVGSSSASASAVPSSPPSFFTLAGTAGLTPGMGGADGCRRSTNDCGSEPEALGLLTASPGILKPVGTDGFGLGFDTAALIIQEGCRGWASAVSAEPPGWAATWLPNRGKRGLAKGFGLDAALGFEVATWSSTDWGGCGGASSSTAGACVGASAAGPGAGWSPAPPSGALAGTGQGSAGAASSAGTAFFGSTTAAAAAGAVDPLAACFSGTGGGGMLVEASSPAGAGQGVSAAKDSATLAATEPFAPAGAAGSAGGAPEVDQLTVSCARVGVVLVSLASDLTFIGTTSMHPPSGMGVSMSFRRRSVVAPTDFRPVPFVERSRIASLLTVGSGWPSAGCRSLSSAW
mmetsp:Transcript_28779/g.91723  ORF Transcript_28779/g.91723 Transcript_28779/m.91723 type:complete len:777 (+) Transcript_28779:1009-3339(+)